MGNAYTEAQKRASLKFQKDKAQIKITVDKAQRERYKAHAQSKGKTLTDLIVDLLESDITHK